jgi:hypothetical protein
MHGISLSDMPRFGKRQSQGQLLGRLTWKRRLINIRRDRQERNF